MRFKPITKENGFIYNSTRERVDSRNQWRWKLHLMGSCSGLHLITSNVRGVRKLYLCNLGTGIRILSLLSS